jgi:hypothetical protein
VRRVLPPSHIALAAGLAFGLAACDGCRERPAESNAARFISADDDVVLIGDVSAGAHVIAVWQRVFETLLTDSQRQQAEQELALFLGFDPLDRESLKAAGFEPEAQWAAGWSAERDHWIVALPASDAKTLAATAIDLARRRFGAEARTDNGVTRLVTAFGTEEVERAAVAIREGVVLWVVGHDAAGVLATVKPMEAEASAAPAIATSPGAQVRGRVNVDGPALAAWARRARIRDGERIATQIASWAERLDISLAFSKAGLDLDGRFALTEAGRTALDDARPEASKSLGAVRAVAVPDAILVALGAVDPNLLFETVLPENSEARKALDRARAQDELAFDVERQLVPALSGAFGVSVGAGDLSELTFRELVGAPQKTLWTSFAIGRRADADASPYEQILESARETPSMTVENRALGDVQITAFRTAGTLLTEVAEIEHAWVASNEPAVMNRVLGNEPADAPPPPLLRIELRFSELHRVLKTFRAGSLPLFVRATWAQILDAVDLLGTASVEADPEGGALGVDFDLRLRPPEAPAASP